MWHRCGSARGRMPYQPAQAPHRPRAYRRGLRPRQGVVAAHAFETPTGSGIHVHDILTVSLGGVGVIQHVINSTGGATPSNTTSVDVTSYP